MKVHIQGASNADLEAAQEAVEREAVRIGYKKVEFVATGQRADVEYRVIKSKHGRKAIRSLQRVPF